MTTSTDRDRPAAGAVCRAPGLTSRPLSVKGSTATPRPETTRSALDSEPPAARQTPGAATDGAAARSTRGGDGQGASMAKHRCPGTGKPAARRDGSVYPHCPECGEEFSAQGRVAARRYERAWDSTPMHYTGTPTSMTDRDKVEALLKMTERAAQLLAAEAELREREIADAYERGRRDGMADPEALRATYETAREVEADRLALGLAEGTGLDGTVEDRIAERRAAVRRWVETGDDADYPVPGYWRELGGRETSSEAVAE